MIDTGQMRRSWALLPANARRRVVKSAALSATLNGVGAAGAPYLISMGGLHQWQDLEALAWVCLYGGLIGLFLHFRQPGYRLEARPKQWRKGA